MGEPGAVDGDGLLDGGAIVHTHVASVDDGVAAALRSDDCMQVPCAYACVGGDGGRKVMWDVYTFSHLSPISPIPGLGSTKARSLSHT